MRYNTYTHTDARQGDVEVFGDPAGGRGDCRPSAEGAEGASGEGGEDAEDSRGATGGGAERQQHHRRVEGL